MRKKRRGDRKDAWLVRKIDPFQRIIPFLLPGRNVSCVYIKETIDATNLIQYVKEKNEALSSESKIDKYTYFHVFLAAACRTLALRPHMNRFISGNRIYQRKKIVLGFIAKKAFTEEAMETTVKVAFDRDATIDEVAEKISRNINEVKGDNSDDTIDVLSIIAKLPKFMVKLIVKFVDWLDNHGWYPKAFTKIDPMQCSVFLANLGSIGLENVPYHHLYDRGNCSLFVVIGKIHKKHEYVPEKGFIEKDVAEIAITLDERVSNGFYYIKAIELFKQLIEDPKQLEIKPKEVPTDE